MADDDDVVVADHPAEDDLAGKINPPDPIEHEDGTVEYPPDPNYTPEGNADDYDLTPVEGDEPVDDHSPSDSEEG